MLQTPTVTDVEGAGGPARPGRGAGRQWRAGRREIVRPARPLQRPTREKVRPARQKTPILGHYDPAGRTFSRSHPPPDPAGRTFSRTGRTEVMTVKPTTPLQPLTWASMKPPSPLLAPEQQPLKPVAPLQPKNTPKTPISHPQRRWQFHTHTDTSEQRRQGFQTHRATSPAAPRRGARGRQRHHRHPHFARNLSRSFFEIPQKRCNSNDAN